jgi:hypothetical protein
MPPAAAERDPSGSQSRDRVAAASATEEADARPERHVADLRTRLRLTFRDCDAAAFEALARRSARTEVRWAVAGARP